MVPRIGKGRRLHVYLDEWMDERGLDDKRLAERLNVDRTTVTKWRSNQERLDPAKMTDIAYALGLDDPKRLFDHPAWVSVDSIIQDAPEDIRAAVADVARRLAGRG